MEPPGTTLGTGTSDNADPAIGKLLSSLSFTRSRREAEAICADPDAIRRLVAAARRTLEDRDLQALDDRAEPVLQRIERVAADADRYDRMSPAEQARHRLQVAAVHYLARRDDAIPDDQPGGSVDDMLVLTGIVTAVRDAEGRHR